MASSSITASGLYAVLVKAPSDSGGNAGAGGTTSIDSMPQILDSTGNVVGTLTAVLDSTGTAIVELTQALLDKAFTLSSATLACLNIPAISGASAYQLVLPGSFFSSKGSRALEIQTPLGVVSVPDSMLSTLSEDKGRKVDITIRQGDRAGLTEELGKARKSLSTFNNSDTIAFWAKDAMTLFVQTGIISGNGGKLFPTNTTTRAEVAQVLYNLLSK